MNTRTLLLATVISLVLWLGIFEAVTHAATPPKGEIGTAVLSVTKLAPPWFCTMKNRLTTCYARSRYVPVQVTR